MMLMVKGIIAEAVATNLNLNLNLESTKFNGFSTSINKKKYRENPQPKMMFFR